MPQVVKEFGDVGNYIAKVAKVKTRDFLMSTWTGLVNSTPVKTGKARYSWKVSPGSPFTREIPDGTYGYPPQPNLDTYTRNWKTWYISNTAPYIDDLNNGSSQQAPAGFIQTVINRNLIRYA